MSLFVIKLSYIIRFYYARFVDEEFTTQSLNYSPQLIKLMQWELNTWKIIIAVKERIRYKYGCEPPCGLPGTGSLAFLPSKRKLRACPPRPTLYWTQNSSCIVSPSCLETSVSAPSLAHRSISRPLSLASMATHHQAFPPWLPFLPWSTFKPP